MDILVTVGVILLLIALAALMIHLINTHHEQRIAALDYERFHPGDPPDPEKNRTRRDEEAQPPRDQRNDDQRNDE